MREHDYLKVALKNAKPKTVSKRAQSNQHSRASSAVVSRQGSRNASDDDDDGNLSDGTSWSVNSIDDMLSAAPQNDVGGAWVDELNNTIESIIDRKRSSTEGREKSLGYYVHSLMSRYAADVIEPRTHELLPALLKSVKLEDSEKEACAALKAIAMTVVTESAGTSYEVVNQELKRCYKSSESPTVQAAAIHCLGAVAGFGGAGDTGIEEIMDELLEIIESDGSSIDAPDSAEVVVAACAEWGFLATQIEDLEDRTEAAMDAFVEQLDSSDPYVQVAAGENIALLFEKSYTAREADDEEPSQQLDEQGNYIDNSWVKRYDVYRQMSQLEHKLSQLANESSKRIAKKDRKVLHTSFADILNTVEHPSMGPKYNNAIDQETGRPYGSRMVVRIHKHGSMKIDKWWKLHCLQELRRVLGGGFVVHYEDNPVVFEALPIMLNAEK